jgi:hypothetical protein
MESKKREQLNTPRQLTAEELDMVFGGCLKSSSEELKEFAEKKSVVVVDIRFS